MEEKERYELLEEDFAYAIVDNEEHKTYQYDYFDFSNICDLLNQQDKENQQLKQELKDERAELQQLYSHLEVEAFGEDIQEQAVKEIDKIKEENQQLKQQLKNEKNTTAELVSLIDTMRYEDPKINELEKQLHDLPKNILKDIQENFDWKQCCEIRKYYDQQYIWFNYVAFNDFLDAILKKFGGEND